jgi:three-Cys-motif partner protein
MASASTFFEESKANSRVKSEIVSAYFTGYMRIIGSATKGSSDRLAYIDLCSGPGYYTDGIKSTPILNLETAIASPDLQARLVTIFREHDEGFINSLTASINALPGIEKLKYQPDIKQETVGPAIARELKDMSLVPTLLFIDPFGYDELSLDLFGSVLKDWACDCIFFFNYNRINMILNNPILYRKTFDIFGETRAEELIAQVKSKSPEERQQLIMEALKDALAQIKGKYVLPFKFYKSGSNKTSHHIILVTKSFAGYHLMKEIMAKRSSSFKDGVPSFEFNELLIPPVSLHLQLPLFAVKTEIEKLADDLCIDFKGKCTTVFKIYEIHCVGKDYILKNYKEALLILEKKGLISVTTSKTRRKEGTMADHLNIQFK